MFLAIAFVQLDEDYYLHVFITMYIWKNNHGLFYHRVIQDFHLILEWFIYWFAVYDGCDMWYVQRVLPELSGTFGI